LHYCFSGDSGEGEMPQGLTNHKSVKELREIIAALGLSASQAAKLMGLERTLVWRAVSGRPITLNNASIIAQRLHLLNPNAVPIIYNVSLATNLLHYLLRAVEAYERGKTAAEKNRNPRN
jgi:hypothetical protein